MTALDLQKLSAPKKEKMGKRGKKIKFILPARCSTNLL